MARGVVAVAPGLVMMLGLVGCSAGTEREGAPAVPVTSASRSPSVSLGAPGCDPPSPIRPLRAPSSAPGLPEVQGTGRGAELWGLVMARRAYPPIPVGEEVKIVWRMTGTGPLQLALTGPDGRSRPLAWGPDKHSGSNYDRPGEEWGAGFLFTEPGCWHVRATRSAAFADVWLEVG
jgi:hypothetical protein